MEKQKSKNVLTAAGIEPGMAGTKKGRASQSAILQFGTYSADGSSRSSDPGGTSIGDDLVGLGVAGSSNGESSHGELPVGLGREGNIVDGSLAVGGVDGSVGDESGILSSGGLELPVHPDGEEGLVQLGEDILHGWGDLVDGQSGPSQSHDSVHWLASEDAGQGGGYSEFLAGYFQSTEGENILGQVTLARAGSVLDGEGSRLGLVGGRLAGVERMAGVAAKNRY